MGVTASTGLVYLVVLTEVWKISRMIELNLESPLEPWSIAFSAPKQLEDGSSCFSVYSGSDDSVLRFASYTINNEYVDGNQQSDEADPAVLRHSAIVTKKHTAGVTAILPLSIITPDGGRIIVTGSYDDHIRLFSLHDLDQTAGFPMVRLLLEENLGGGVWRLDPVKVEENAGTVKIMILVSCMHAGARVVEFSSADRTTWRCEVTARFEEHKSMNYGSDFVRSTTNGPVKCVSTSFYDRLLCVWEYRSS
jgi:diphthamide biosynthesis protein 7